MGAVDLPGELRAQIAEAVVRPGPSNGQARPLDQDAGGPVLGDGAVAVVLKRLEDAERDGDAVYAVVRGVGTASGAMARPDALERALRGALHDADVASVDYVEAHGSGAPAEDRAEAVALSQVLGGAEHLG